VENTIGTRGRKAERGLNIRKVQFHRGENTGRCMKELSKELPRKGKFRKIA